MEFFEGIIVTLYMVLKAANGVCSDSTFKCGYWASIHECEINPAYFVPTCPLSCKNPCECSVFTSDTACDCLLRAKNGECEENPTLLNSICKTTCKKRLTTNCPSLPLPGDANAHLTSTETAYLTTVDQVCNAGWEPELSAHKGRRLCGSDGAWLNDNFHDAEVKCQRVDCGAPPEIQHGSSIYTSTLFESTVTYTCDLGYKVTSGDLIRTCDETASWNGKIPVCEVITCPGPPSVPYSVRTGDSNVYDSNINYSCNIGYSHSAGDLHRRCQLSGEWSGSLPVCTIKHCPVPVAVAHASLGYDTTHYLSYVTYMCLIGYNHTSGDLTRRCQADQQWSGEEPVCTILSCGEPALSAGAKWNATGFNYSDTVYYECYLQEDENNINSWTRVCGPEAEWTGNEGKCAAIRRKFEATPVEAKGSVAFGTVAMSILIVIMLCIIILDIPTVYNQSKYLRKNVRNFRRIVKAKMHQLMKDGPNPHKRLSVDVAVKHANEDGGSVNLSTLSLKTLNEEDDGLRVQSASSKGRGAWSCRTSLTTLPSDDVLLDANVSMETVNEVLSDLGNDSLDDDVMVNADVEIHNIE